MQENLTVIRLGPNFRIESGVIFQLFLGSIRASHIGLNGGIIFAAAVDYPDDIKSNKKSYKKIPEGFEYLYFYGSCDGKVAFHYDSLVWMKELEEGASPVSLIKEKSKPIEIISMYERSIDQRKDGNISEAQLRP